MLFIVFFGQEFMLQKENMKRGRIISKDSCVYRVKGYVPGHGPQVCQVNMGIYIERFEELKDFHWKELKEKRLKSKPSW